MSDHTTRSLERAAAEGDTEAAEALRRAALRAVAAKWAPSPAAWWESTNGGRYLLHLWLMDADPARPACRQLAEHWPLDSLRARIDATREDRWRCHACERYALREGIALAGLGTREPNRHGRRRGEDGRRVAPEPCDTFRESNAPGYCWCGWWCERHAEAT